MKTFIDTFQHMRYPTAGDWAFPEDGTLFIAVRDLGDWKMNALVAVHEFVEAVLCKAHGVSDTAVDEFDLHVFPGRVAAGTNRADEPGDEPDAPYHREHVFAGMIESQLAVALGVDWEAYEEKIAEKIAG